MCLWQRLTQRRLLLQGYDNTESSVRKASVFCLVAIYSVIGEELKPYLAQLTGSKVRFLSLSRLQRKQSNQYLFFKRFAVYLVILKTCDFVSDQL